jgi:hypothetical protein
MRDGKCEVCRLKLFTVLELSLNTRTDNLRAVLLRVDYDEEKFALRLR